MRIFRHPDVAAVEALLASCNLPSADLEARHFAHFFACGPAHALTGVVGLELYGSVALLRSLAVAPEARGQGLGKQLVAHMEAHAAAQGVSALYLLTDTAAPLFLSLGYAVTERAAAPAEIRGTRQFASQCPASAAFMVKRLGG